MKKIYSLKSLNIASIAITLCFSTILNVESQTLIQSSGSLKKKSNVISPLSAAPLLNVNNQRQPQAPLINNTLGTKSSFKNFVVPGTVYLNEGFEDTLTFPPINWTLIDGDGDGVNWKLAPGFGNAGSLGSTFSESYNGAALSPENYLITPAVDLSAAGGNINLNYMVLTYDADFFPEHYKVVVSTTGNSKNDFNTGTIVFEETLTYTGKFEARTVDLSSFSGDTIYVAWVHYNVTDMYLMVLDDIIIKEPKDYDAAITSMSTSLPSHTIIPIAQVKPFSFSSLISNKGGKPVTGLNLSASVIGGPTLNATSDSLGAGADTILTTSLFSPDSVSTYTVAFEVKINEADGDATNNTDTMAVYINDSIYARDYTIFGVYSGGVGYNTTTGLLGSVFTLNYPDTLTEIMVMLEQTKLGDSIRFEVYNWSDTTQVFESETYIFDTTAGRGIRNYRFNKSLPLNFGNYMITVNQLTDSSNIQLTTDGDANGEIYGKTTGWFRLTTFGNGGIWPIFGTPYVPPFCDTNTLALVTSSLQPSCAGDNDGVAKVSVSGGNTPYSYVWDDAANQTTSTAVGLNAGMYYVSVMDAKTCWKIDSVFINDPLKLDAKITSFSNANCGSADGSASVSAFDGTASYSYLWSNGSTTATVTNLKSGSYGVIVTDSKGCVKTKVGVLSNIGGPGIDIFEDKPISCFGESDGALWASVSGGKAPYTYLWYDLLGDTLSAVDYIDSLLDDTYIVEVLDSVGCKSIKSYHIKQPEMLNIWLTTGDVKCNGDWNGWVVATAYGGTSPYGYSWSTGDTTNWIGSLYAGYYVIDVYDTNDCWAMDTVWINQPDELMIYTDANDATCSNNDGSAWASAAGGSASYWYSWTTGDKTSSVDSLFSGIYTVTVRDDSGCWEWDIVAVVDSNGPQVVAKDSLSTMCNGGSDGEAWVSVSGGTAPYTYLWTNILTGDTASMDDAATGLMMGWYVVSIWDSNGCKSLDGVYIDEPEIMQIWTDSLDASCAGYNDGSAVVSAWGESGMYNYIWSTGDTTYLIDSLVAGGYAVTVYDANGCDWLVDSVYILEPEMLEVWTDGWDVSCNAYADGAVWASAAGGTSPYWYSWSNNDNGEWVDSILAGTYVVTVYDGNDCWTMDTVMVDDSMALSLVITGTNLTCNGNNDGEAFVIASSGNVPYYYLWSTSIDTTSKISGLDAGTYAVTVMDDSGCIEIASVTLSEPLVLSVSTSTTFDSTVQKGTATAVALGGIVPYSYKWSDGSTTATATGLPEGTYTVTVTDANGCVVADTAKVVGKPGSINELSKSAFVSLYPNPTNGSISIEIHSGKSQILEIGIYNVLGAKVGSIESSKSSKYIFHADLTTLNDGIYFVRVKTADSSYVTKVTLNK